MPKYTEQYEYRFRFGDAGDWSDWMSVSEIADELDTTYDSVRKTAVRQGTYHGFEVRRRELEGAE